jgi:gas vesicle protein
MSSGKILLGVLAGVAVGATLGILFAPDNGSKTRKKIVDKSNDYAEDMEDKFNEFIDGITKQFQATKDESTRIAQNGIVKAEETIAEVATFEK